MTSINPGKDGKYRLHATVNGKVYRAVLGNNRELAEAEVKKFYIDPEEWLKARELKKSKASILEIVAEYLARSKMLKNGNHHTREQARVLRTMARLSLKRDPRLSCPRKWAADNCCWYIRCREEQGISLPTYRREFFIMKSFWNWVRDRGYVTKSPMKSLVAPPKWPVKQNRRKVITSDQIKKLQKHLDKEAFSAVVLMWYCGLKPGEIEGLKDKDLGKEVRVDRFGFTESLKCRKPLRYVPVTSPVVREAFYVVLAALTRSPPYRFLINHKLTKALKALKEPRFKAGDLRDAAITRWVDEGIHLVTIAKWSGHGSLDEVAKYVDKKNQPLALPVRIDL